MIAFRDLVSKQESDPMKISNRDRLRLLGGAAAYAGLGMAGLPGIAGGVGLSSARTAKRKVLKAVLTPEPPSLVTAFNSAVMVQQISPKMMDGLASYDRDMKPIPSLATEWETAADEAVDPVQSCGRT